METCNWRNLWLRINYLTNGRAENHSRSRILLQIQLKLVRGLVPRRLTSPVIYSLKWWVTSIIARLAPWACKMNQIARCDWLPQRTWDYPPKSFTDQAFLVKMAGYWPPSFFASLWTSTPSRSINRQKKNVANIQPSWPHPWSITHISFLVTDHFLYWFSPF